VYEIINTGKLVGDEIDTPETTAVSFYLLKLAGKDAYPVSL
jgi:hypothetical protein